MQTFRINVTCEENVLRKNCFKTILTIINAIHLKIYAVNETALYSNKEFQHEFYGGPYYPKHET